MPTISSEVIKELKGNRRWKGTCPGCSEVFRLADAALFPLDAKLTQEALVAVKAARAQLAERRLELEEMRIRMTLRAKLTAHAVNLGKMIEKIVPSFSTFSYAVGECRALYEPIDYIVFSGLSKGRVESITFVDVKSGGSRLNQCQRSIKQAVEIKAVSIKTLESE
jgi:predicted Holliday junction resolvase-like endonuclease